MAVTLRSYIFLIAPNLIDLDLMTMWNLSFILLILFIIT